MDEVKPFPNQQQKVGTKTCGPSSLTNIYAHFGKEVGLEKILNDLKVKDDETTYLPQLARHIQQNGLATQVLSSCPFNMSPDWKDLDKSSLIENLKAWTTHHHKNPWIKDALFLLYYLEEGGRVNLVDLSTKLIDEELTKGNVVLCCLEESWLWGKRKVSNVVEYDSIRGEPRGHFVVVYGQKDDEYLVSDPYPTNLPERQGLYSVSKDKLLVSVLVWNPEVLVVAKA